VRGEITVVLAGAEPNAAPDLATLVERVGGLVADGVQLKDAAGEVAAALTAAGYRVVREEADELFAGMDADLREFLVAAPPRELRLTLCRLDRHRAPVVMDLGPVMHLDDLVATKVAALANRREVRDYIDVAAALGRYPLARVLELAHAADPALDPETLTAAVMDVMWVGFAALKAGARWAAGS